VNAALVRTLPDTPILRQAIYATPDGYLMVSTMTDAPHVGVDPGRVDRFPETLVWSCDANGEAADHMIALPTEAVDPVKALAELGYTVAVAL
jgi:hypothetical protein